MYCIQCGVELAAGEKKCPLCGTVVFHPDFITGDNPSLYPKPEAPREEFNRKGVLFIMTFLFLIPLLVTLVCDLSLNERMVWSGYPIGALLLFYAVIVLPMWVRRPNPVIFLPVDFGVALLYLFYINYAVGGKWFWSFAMPVTLMVGALVCAVVTLCRYLHRGHLFVFGGASLVSGTVMVGIELLVNRSFGIADHLVWSIYPQTVFVLIGIMLLIIAFCRPLQESLKRKFFI